MLPVRISHGSLRAFNKATRTRSHHNFHRSTFWPKGGSQRADIRDAVDYVLTFEEVAQLFEFTGIDPAEFEEDMRDHSSLEVAYMPEPRGNKLQRCCRTPVHRKPTVRAIQANGIRECKAIMQS